MNIYKISNHLDAVLKDVGGNKIPIPESSIELNDYVYKEDIEDNSVYFIEASPDMNNPLSYAGVNIALMIYFKHLQAEKMRFKIVLLGFESKESFLLDCPYSLLVKCENVIYRQISPVCQPERYLEQDIKTVSKNKSISCLKRIGIMPPTSYKSHHSISNEWSIYRWSRYLGIVSEIEEEIKNSLYFQYLKTIYDIKNIESNRNFLVAKGKLLIIDDEINKGWKSFFSSLKLPGHRDLKIKYTGADFKKITDKNEIVSSIENSIKEFNPDTVILDLRLHDSDFDKISVQELTGYKALQKIKEINPGIQVIIFTASNKINNYHTLNKLGFDGWILKESPELSVDENYTKNVISELKKQIDTCLQKKYLKNIYDEQKRLFEKFENENRKSKFIQKLKKQMELSYNLLTSAKSEEQFAYAFISLYQVIEIVNNEWVDVSNDVWQIKGAGDLLDWDWKENKYTHTNTPVKGSKPPEWQKFTGIYFQKWEKKSHSFVREIAKMIQKRNGFVHNDKKILDYLDKSGKFINHDIYTHKAYLELFGYILKIAKSV